MKSLPGLDVRPTPDRLRETLFNVLASRIEGTVFLDAYAGTGAVGIEALSRGASRAYFVDRARAAASVIRENLSALGILDRSEVFCGKASTLLERLRADIVFLDPPYPLEQEYETALRILGETAPPLVIVQHAPRLQLAGKYGKLRHTRTIRHGDNALSFYAPM